MTVFGEAARFTEAEMADIAEIERDIELAKRMPPSDIVSQTIHSVKPVAH